MKLDDIYPAVLTIVLVGMVLGIGVYVLSTLGGNLYLSTTGTNTNESHGFATGTTITLNASTLRAVSCGTITSIENGTAGSEITKVGNWSQSGCIITNLSSTYSVAGSNVAWLVTYPYTYDADTEASKSVNTTAYGIGNFADWIAIIVVVIAAAIVLGLVLSSFGRKTPGV